MLARGPESIALHLHHLPFIFPCLVFFVSSSLLFSLDLHTHPQKGKTIMGRSPCCEKEHTNKGAWTKEEDERLVNYIKAQGEGCWRSLPKAAGKFFFLFSFLPTSYAVKKKKKITLRSFYFGSFFFFLCSGLLRCGKSCRLRWINYLRPDLKRGNFSDEEDELIINLHSLLGNK